MNKTDIKKILPKGFQFSIWILVSLFICLIISLNFSLSLWAQSSPVGILSNLQGDVWVQYKDADEIKPAMLGIELKEGDKIITDKNSTATIYYYHGSIKNIPEKIQYEVFLEEVRGGGNSKENLSIMAEGDKIFSMKNREESLKQAYGGNLRTLDRDSLRLIYPAFTVEELRPDFVFLYDEDINDEEMKIVVEDENFQPVLSFTFKGITQVPYPAGKDPLKPGETYYWHVRSVHDIGDDLPRMKSFQIASSELMEEIRELDNKLKDLHADQSTYLLIMGNFRKSRELYWSATTDFEELSTIHPRQKLPHQELMLLYYATHREKDFETEKEILKQIESNP